VPWRCWRITSRAAELTVRGQFITLEGGEGGGKTTQARLLADALTRQGLPVLRTREPGGAKGSELLRALLLGGTIDWSVPAETLLHFAARSEHVERCIRPAISAGMWVVCDRYSDSTMAYQGYGQGADRAAIATLAGLMRMTPDLTLMLDVPDDIATERLRRRAGEPDRYERLDAQFHRRVADGFRAIAAAEPGRCATIAAGGTVEAVHAAILTVVAERLG
jgi:dTMP kinase